MARARAAEADGPDWPGQLKGRHRQVFDVQLAFAFFGWDTLGGEAVNGLSDAFDALFDVSLFAGSEAEAKVLLAVVRDVAINGRGTKINPIMIDQSAGRLRMDDEATLDASGRQQYRQQNC